jgi:hypothetical protein
MIKINTKIAAVSTALIVAASAILTVPASAAVLDTVSVVTTLDGVETINDGSTSALAIDVPTPSTNKVDADYTVKFVVTTDDAATAVSAVASGVKLVSTLNSTNSAISAANGTSTLTLGTGAGVTVSFYVYSTSTTVGTVVLTVGTDAPETYYIEGAAGEEYNLSVSHQAKVDLGSTSKVSAVVTDVFGNAVTSGVDFNENIINGTLGGFTYNATSKKWEASYVAPSTAGKTTFSVDVDATAVTGLAAPVDSYIGTVDVMDVNALVSALEAKQAKLIAKYNKLAAKWNKAFPNKKVKKVS